MRSLLNCSTVAFINNADTMERDFLFVTLKIQSETDITLLKICGEKIKYFIKLLRIYNY